jgi:hypothetical protein
MPDEYTYVSAVSDDLCIPSADVRVDRSLDEPEYAPITD